VKLVPFPLHPETPAAGMSLDELFGGRGGDPNARQARNEQMKARMAAEGLPYGERTHTYNSRLAQELGLWADTQPGGETLHDALFKAYFVDNRNIGDPDVLLDLVKSLGLDVEGARKALEARSFSDAVDGDWARARQYGITGVPTFVAGGYGVVGAQPYEVLEQLMTELKVPKRS
jgi:predicted DsbA family dithiol-disulfide isomerase